MSNYLYNNYVKTLTDQFKRELGTIKTEHNFEFGPEFEIAICEVLQDVLPSKYGIARGYIVNQDGDSAGDDIVIYQKERFPTLALRDNKFARKEFVPLEATYCYIEAKHTINLEGNDRQSLQFACGQVSKAKKLAKSRNTKEGSNFSEYIHTSGPISVDMPEDFPDYLNPLYGIVFARQVRERQNGPIISNSKAIEKILNNYRFESEYVPDLIVLDQNNLIIPTLRGKEVRSPFFIPGKSTPHLVNVNGVSYGIALLSLMSVLDWIKLGAMPWHKIIVDALDIPFS